MSQWLQWIILTSITGSPIVSALVLIVVWYTIDRFTLGLMPDPVRWFLRWRREGTLKRALLANVHDRQARRELAELYVLRKKYAAAVEMLKPNLEVGDDDISTVFTMGVACLGAGHVQQGEKLLAHVQELDHDFRVGEVDFALGRSRLKRGDFKAAKDSLEAAVTTRSGTIEGRVLLAMALAGLKDDGAAALKRDEAWNEYVTAPRFQRRKERWWAYRARPSRPALYLAAILMGLFLFGVFGAPKIASLAAQLQKKSGGIYADPDMDPLDP